MVSDALLGFVGGFADAYGAARKPYFDTLAREEANKEITLSRNLDLINNLVENSSAMQDLSSEEKEAFAKRFGSSVNSATIYKIAELQSQGGEVFKVADKGPYAAGNNKFVNINSLTKPTNKEKWEKQLDAFLTVSAKMNLVANNEESLIAAWRSIPTQQREMARGHLDNNKDDYSSRINLALRAGYIDRKTSLDVGTGQVIDSYKFNEAWVNKSETAAMFKTLGFKKDEPEALFKFLYSDTINLLRARQYRNAWAGNPQSAQAVLNLKNPVNDPSTNMTNIDAASINSPVVTKNTGSFGGQHIAQKAMLGIVRKYTVPYFENIIERKSTTTPRDVVINAITKFLLENLKSNQYITGDETEAERAIREYIGNQYDQASKGITQ
jgi:hypothetical protein